MSICRVLFCSLILYVYFYTRRMLQFLALDAEHRHETAEGGWERDKTGRGDGTQEEADQEYSSMDVLSNN